MLRRTKVISYNNDLKWPERLLELTILEIFGETTVLLDFLHW